MSSMLSHYDAMRHYSPNQTYARSKSKHHFLHQYATWIFAVIFFLVAGIFTHIRWHQHTQAEWNDSSTSNQQLIMFLKSQTGYYTIIVLWILAFLSVAGGSWAMWVQHKEKSVL